MERSPTPIFSVIIPSYNRAYILGAAIESVLTQTFPDWEMIVVDDGSTDKTRELVLGFDDERIKYVYEENAGPCAARNRGMSIARGEWICYLDSDNEFLPNYLEVMLGWIEKNPGVLFAIPKQNRILELWENGELVKSIDDSKDFPETLTIKDVFMRKNHLDENGFMHSRKIGMEWDKDLNRMEVWEFAMRIGERYPDSFLYVPIPLVNYHQRFGGDGLVSNTSYERWAETFEYIYQKHKNDKLMQGQSWYPAKVRQYTQMQKDFEDGKAPSPVVRYFV